MTDTTTTDLFDQLGALLGDERAALLNGDLESLGDILGRKENLIEALEKIQPKDFGALSSLHEKVARNQVLFDQALEGIRNVSNRLSALRRLRKTLETYDELGRKQEIVDPAGNRLERRA